MIVHKAVEPTASAFTARIQHLFHNMVDGAVFDDFRQRRWRLEQAVGHHRAWSIGHKARNVQHHVKVQVAEGL